MELTVIFSEFSEELGVNIIIGEKYLGEISEVDAHSEAKRIADTLTEIKTGKISYMLQNEKMHIVAELPK